jgi:hypothetical protein
MPDHCPICGLPVKSPKHKTCGAKTCVDKAKKTNNIAFWSNRSMLGPPPEELRAMANHARLAPLTIDGLTFQRVEPKVIRIEMGDGDDCEAVLLSWDLCRKIFSLKNDCVAEWLERVK